jgi:hypothetical protein
MAHLKNLGNEYASCLGTLFDRAPKAVLAAIAVSYASVDHLPLARINVLREWWLLYDNGIVPQRPPEPRPIDEEAGP